MGWGQPTIAQRCGSNTVSKQRIVDVLKVGRNVGGKRILMSGLPCEVTLPPHASIEAASGLEAHWANIRHVTAPTFTPFDLHGPHLGESGNRRRDHVN